jgi:hypothetical protein
VASQEKLDCMYLVSSCVVSRKQPVQLSLVESYILQHPVAKQ